MHLFQNPLYLKIQMALFQHLMLYDFFSVLLHSLLLTLYKRGLQIQALCYGYVSYFVVDVVVVGVLCQILLFFCGLLLFLIQYGTTPGFLGF